MAESKAPRGAVNVVLEVEARLPTIEADQHQLAQVFTNLIANAFEALDGQGHIRIAAAAGWQDDDPALTGHQDPQPIVIVDVLDDGPGVPNDIRDKIFFPSSRPSRRVRGWVSLSFERSSMRTTDASTVSAMPGNGTRFRVTLPVPALPSGSDSRKVRMGRSPECRRSRCPAPRAGSRADPREVHDVEEASNGNAAIERLHDSYFDVGPERSEDGRQRRHGRAAHHAAMHPDDGGHPDDCVRLGQYRGRGDEDRAPSTTCRSRSRSRRWRSRSRRRSSTSA
jgi:hypothetical protein